jgi:transcriptional regulator with XRE-family HTH domain
VDRQSLSLDLERGDNPVMNRVELADFLRRRREALKPGDVGLANGARRRTNGLRREEVAALSGMSTDYYTRLEQQRGPQPSEQMLASIARGLRLTLDERDHLFRLAGHNAPARALRTDHVSPALLRVLDRLDDTPAQVVSDLGETLVQNRAAIALLGDHSRFTGPARSAIYRWFTNPSARSLFPERDHDLHGRLHVASLRAAMTRNGADDRAAALVQRLRKESQEFAELWNLHEVAVRRESRKDIIHPEMGFLELDCQVLFIENQTQALLVYTATPGSESDEKLRRLIAECAREPVFETV